MLRVALFVPAVLVLLTVVGHRADPMYQWFLGRFIARLGGTPLYLTLLASAAFYGYAALRRVPMAFDALTAVLVALAFVSPHTLDLDTLVPPRALPILAAAAVQTAVGAASSGVRGAAWSGQPSWWPPRQSPCADRRGESSRTDRVPSGPDRRADRRRGVRRRLGRFLRTAGAATALLGSLVAMTGQVEHTGMISSWMVEVYPLVMAILIAGYGFVLGYRPSITFAWLIVSCWLAVMGYRGYLSLRRAVVGLDYIAIGMLLLGLAILTSMAKGGVLPGRFGDRRGKVSNAPN